MTQIKPIDCFGENEFESVIRIVGAYFEGLHHGNVSTLRALFHPDAYLKAPGLRRSLEDWLQHVSKRAVPSEEGLPYEFKLRSIEITGEQAMVKLDCPLFEHVYVDYLGLLKENGRWLIVNKMYSDIRE